MLDNIDLIAEGHKPAQWMLLDYGLHGESNAGEELKIEKKQYSLQGSLHYVINNDRLLMRGKHLPWIDRNSNLRREGQAQRDREGKREQCTHKMQSVSVYIDTITTTFFEKVTSARSHIPREKRIELFELRCSPLVSKCERSNMSTSRQ